MKDKKINLLEGNILKALIMISTPLMATAFVDMAYNMTDTAWLGRVGNDAVAGTGAAHFFIWMAFSITLIAKIGTSVYVAQEYGSKRNKELSNTIKNGFILNFFFIVAYIFIVQLFAPKLLGFFNLDGNVTRIGVRYLKVISIGGIFSLTNPLISAIYNSLGDSVRPFKINAMGLIFNLVLDPIFIFGFNWGYLGAAYATVLSQFIVFLLFTCNIIRTKNEIYLAVFEGSYSFPNIIRKVRMGLPAGLQSLIHASISLVLSRFITSYGSDPLAVFTIGSMIESITWMTTEGFQVGIISIVGQNFGAGKIKRLKEIIRKSMLTVGSIGLLTSFILIFFRTNIFRLFLPGYPETIKMGEYYLLILGFSQLFMAIEIGATGVFSGLGETRPPAFISMAFNLIRIPLAILLMKDYQFYGVWIAITISSILKGLILNIFLYKRYRNIK